jgi:hypothetical protein
VRHRLVREDLPRILAGRLDCLPENIRIRVRQELQDVILDYTGDVFRAIRSTAIRGGEEPWQEES